VHSTLSPRISPCANLSGTLCSSGHNYLLDQVLKISWTLYEHEFGANEIDGQFGMVPSVDFHLFISAVCMLLGIPIQDDDVCVQVQALSVNAHVRRETQGVVLDEIHA